MSDQTNYIALGGWTKWERENHDPQGLTWLMEWMQKNKEAITAVTVEFDPHKSEPDTHLSWTVFEDGD